MVDIIIISYNYDKYIIQLLDSLVHCQKTSKIEQKIIVVDNNSTDKSKALLTEWFKNKTPEYFSLNLLMENRGYSYAVNYGAKQGNNKFIMILNADMLVLDNKWKEVFVNTFNLSKVAVVGCKLINQFNKVVGAGTIGSFQKRRFRAYGVRDTDNKEDIFNQGANCINVCGACYMVRREIFEKLGGFDEDFFMYHEEEYFSFKVQKLLDMWVVYTPYTKFLHYSSPHKAGNESKYVPKASEIFVKKCKEELKIEGVQA